MKLDPAAVGAGVRLEALATIGSTNAEALARARRGERGPLWITAVSQTAGRGRHGRSWLSPAGNLHASLLLYDPSSAERSPQLAFVATLAVRDAIVAEVPSLALWLSFKWPNDLLLAGEKVAGILLEGEVVVDKSVTVVIGVGVNCAHHPRNALTLMEPAHVRSHPSSDEAVLFPATDLRAHDADVTPEQLFLRLSAAMHRRIAQWDRGRGFSIILGDWISAAQGIGETIRVRNGSSEKTGRFVGLDPSGRLVLESHDGNRERISAGDVFPFALRGGRPVPGRQG